MKKLIVLTMMVLMCGAAHGIDTCVKTGTYVGIFRNNTNGTTSESNATNKTWQVTYDYGTLMGIASCNEISGTANTPKTNLVTTTGDTGRYCWCKMWPVPAYGAESGPTSYWMYLSDYGSGNSSACASGCAGACETAMKTNATFRTALFESIW